MTVRPSVLFVCIHNAGRSQMAAGFLRALAGDAVEVRSAGSDPGPHVNPAAVEAMAEVGIDISPLRSTTGAITLDSGYGNTGSPGWCGVCDVGVTCDVCAHTCGQ